MYIYIQSVYRIQNTVYISKINQAVNLITNSYDRQLLRHLNSIIFREHASYDKHDRLKLLEII